jgi:hypothetical protein
MGYEGGPIVAVVWCRRVVGDDWAQRRCQPYNPGCGAQGRECTGLQGFLDQAEDQLEVAME